MSSGRRTFLWMAGFAMVTLMLGAAREFVIARDLKASGAADLFFQAMVVVGAARNFALALFRARWIPLPPAARARALLRRQWGTLGAIIGIALGILFAALGPASWTTPTLWVFALAVVVATVGSTVRALAERAGFERRGFLLEWSVPLGTIVGALAVGRGALGPAVGVTVGLALGLVVLLPSLHPSGEQDPTGVADDPRTEGPPRATRYLLVDTLVYVNLGLVDGLLSPLIYAEGEFAVLNYAGLFVNSVLAVPTAGATVLALRLASRGLAAPWQGARRWAFLGAVAVGCAVGILAWLVGWTGLAAAIDRVAGWPLSVAIAPLVLLSAPFAALRFANTIGRQRVVAEAPRRLMVWDIVGLSARIVTLIALVRFIGVWASPIALAVAESIQLGAWIGCVRFGGAKER